MKKFAFLAFALMLSTNLLLARSYGKEPEYLGLPGDNLNLFAVLKLFQESETLEAFERELNNPDNMVNNLDLNGDNYVDYIKVMHYPDGNVHNIVLRVSINRWEDQDVAVITVEEFRNGGVQIQIIGDEALYGPNYIVEPIYGETPNPGYLGNKYKRHHNTKVKVVTTTYYELANWPVIVYIRQPGYVVWRSAWTWDYYPVYWQPWRPYYWHFYYGYHYNWFGYYYVYFRPHDHIRCRNYHVNYITTIRQISPVVVVNVQNGNYYHFYSRPELRSEGERLYGYRVNMAGGNTPPQRGVRTQSVANNHEITRASGIEAEIRSRAVVAERGTRSDATSLPSRGVGIGEGANRSSRESLQTKPVERGDNNKGSGRAISPVQKPNDATRQIAPARQDMLHERSEPRSMREMPNNRSDHSRDGRQIRDVQRPLSTGTVRSQGPVVSPSTPRNERPSAREKSETTQGRPVVSEQHASRSSSSSKVERPTRISTRTEKSDETTRERTAPAPQKNRSPRASEDIK